MKKICFFAALLCLALFSCKQGAKTNEAANDGADSIAEVTIEVTSQVYLVGTMSDNECQIELALQTDEFGNCAGYVLYPESEPMLLLGTCDKYYGDDGGLFNDITLMEYQADGTVSAKFQLHLSDGEDTDELGFDDGERSFVENEMIYQPAPLTDMTCSSELPEWFPGTPFVPATYDDISKVYGYYLSGPDAYGEFMIEKQGDGKLSFVADESREDYTAACITSQEDRPAEMKGNVIVYENCNDCGYTLTARFYQQFVVVETQQQKISEETNCSYIHAAFVKIVKPNDE